MAEQAARVGHCAHPIRLTGQQHTVRAATGSILSTFASASLPDKVLYVRCNNRRASCCPSCSRTYQGDTWHLLKAGAAGGDKGVPESVASHPMVFATLTAPSFGPVHAAKKPGSRTQRCRPRTRGEVCWHGKSLSCMEIHAEHDLLAGQPFCADCYDYDAHVIWQWWAPELWRRFTIAFPGSSPSGWASRGGRPESWSASPSPRSASTRPAGSSTSTPSSASTEQPPPTRTSPPRWWTSTQTGLPSWSSRRFGPWSTWRRWLAEQPPDTC